MDKIKMAIEVFDKRATDYQEKFMDVSLYHNSFDIFCQHLSNEEAQILEIACGPGNITKYLLGKHPAYNILCTDLAPNMLTLAAANNPSAQTQLRDARHIGTVGRKFDGIMCGFCLPYLSKEEAIAFIHDAYNVLVAGGVLYVSTMEDDYSKSGIEKSSQGDEVYLYYHQADYLVQAFEEAGFTLQSEQHLEYRDGNSKPTTDLVIIANKRQVAIII